MDHSTETRAPVFGVIEGFYGRPWNLTQRLELFETMAANGLGTYIYGPKDDLKLRAEWRSLYDDAEAAELGALVSTCASAGLRLNCAVAPGLDMVYADESDWRQLEGKVSQLLDLGVRDFTLLFDDIPARLSERDAQRFKTFAQAQCAVANQLFAFVRRRVDGGQFFFCPTEYCGRYATPNVGESAYLHEIGRRLDERIDVFWTGPEIVSPTLGAESLREVAEVLRRKPLIWDNFHANDYDIRRVYLGPYAGRDGSVLAEVAGIISNPNCEYEANFVPLVTLAQFAADAEGYDPRDAYRRALAAWLPRFELHGGGTLDLAELELLGDLLYQPFALGDHADRFLALGRDMLGMPPAEWGERYERLLATSCAIGRLFERLTHLRNRELLYTLYQYVWEVRTEATVLADYLTWLRANTVKQDSFGPPASVANTYRGGFTAEVQRLVPVSPARP